jgi:hypothetical protein
VIEQPKLVETPSRKEKLKLIKVKFSVDDDADEVIPEIKSSLLKSVI